MKWTHVVVSLLGFFVSLSLTIQLTVALRGDGYSPLPVALGVFWEGAKAVMIVHGLLLLREGQRREGCALSFVGALLVVGSLVASLAYLTELDDQRQRTAVVSSSQYRRLDSELASLDTQIQVAVDTAAKDTANAYRRRALETLGEVSALRKRRESLSAQLAALESGTAVPTAALSGLSDMGGSTPARIRTWLYVFIAVVLELSSLASVWVVASARKPKPLFLSAPVPVPSAAPVSKPVPVPAPTPKPIPVPVPVPAPSTGRPDTGTDAGADSRYQRFLRLVRAEPEIKVRTLMERLDAGQVVVQRYLRQALAEGKLKRVGRRYQAA